MEHIAGPYKLCLKLSGSRGPSGQLQSPHRKTEGDRSDFWLPCPFRKVYSRECREALVPTTRGSLVTHHIWLLQALMRRSVVRRRAGQSHLRDILPPTTYYWTNYFSLFPHSPPTFLQFSDLKGPKQHGFLHFLHKSLLVAKFQTSVLHKGQL